MSEQQTNVLNESALMHDYNVVNANMMYLFSKFNSISDMNETSESEDDETSSVFKMTMTSVTTITDATERLDANWAIVTIMLTIVEISVSALWSYHMFS